MSYPERGVPVLFGSSRAKDPAYLSAWRQAPLSYSPQQLLDQNWHVDRYETVIGYDPDGELFRRAAYLTLHNRFYTPDVMEITSDYAQEERPVAVGDRILQRIRVFQIGERPMLEMLTMNEVTEVINEPRRASFTYTTTAAHSEVGEWSPTVEWRPNGEVALVIEVVSRSSLPVTLRKWARKLQLRAHTASIQHFQAQLNGDLRAPARQSAAFRVEYLPVGMLLTAFTLFVLAVWKVLRRAE